MISIIKIVDWVEQFLSNRLLRVIVNDSMSDWLQYTSGIPQRSILGPILFLIYVNDLPQCVQHYQIFLYTDDAKLFKRINFRLDCILFQ